MCNEFDVNGSALILKSANGAILNDNWLVIFNNLPISNRYDAALAIINAVIGPAINDHIFEIKVYIITLSISILNFSLLLKNIINLY
jgi:hypothetical protein